VVPLLELRRLQRALGAGLFVLMCCAVVLTASRTGVIGIGLLALWGLLDRRLSRLTRGLLLLAPLFYALAWAGLAAWAELSHHAFGGEARLAEADLSGSRFAIWADTLQLIRQQPWSGVGFGEFNLAWTLTPLPGRPTAFFDHTHDLPLQLLVELGLPLGAALLALLLAALWRAGRLAQQAADRAEAVTRRSACMMLLLIGLHSLLEYPLWYAYFLLPTAWLFGHALGRAAPVASLGSLGGGRRGRQRRAAGPAGTARTAMRCSPAACCWRWAARWRCSTTPVSRACTRRRTTAARWSSASKPASAACCSRTTRPTPRPRSTTRSPRRTRPSRKHRTTCWTRG
jgi:hypothetical protein